MGSSSSSSGGSSSKSSKNKSSSLTSSIGSAIGGALGGPIGGTLGSAFTKALSTAKSSPTYQNAVANTTGASTSTSTPSYQGNIDYFGSPDKYAAAIKEAEAPGGRGLSDPDAAAAFKTDNPQLFNPSYGADASYEAWAKNMGYSDTKAPGDLGREEINRNFGVTPQTSQDIFTDQTGNFYSGKTQQDAFGSSTAYTPATKEDLLAAFPGYQNQLVENQIAPIMSQLQELAQGVNQSTAPLITQQYNAMIGMINDAEAALVARYQEAGSSVDPATQSALSSLRETVERQKKNLMEEMSKRGLLQSGIWAQADIDLSKGEQSEEQRLLSTRLSDLQNQLNQALSNLTQNKIQAAGQFGTAAIAAAESEAQRRQSAIQNLAQMMVNIQNTNIQRQTDLEKMDLERQKYLSGQDWEQAKQVADWTGTIPALYEGDPSAQIRQAQTMWQEANAKGDQAGMDKAHAMAEAFRQAAGWGSGGESGELTDQYMTPAGLPTQEATNTSNEQYWDNYWKQLGYDTDQARLSSDIGYKNYQMNQGVTQQEAEKKTQLLISDLLHFSTPEEAYNFLASEQGGLYANQGADLNKALQALKSRWPEYFKSSSGNLTLDDLKNSLNPQ